MFTSSPAVPTARVARPRPWPRRAVAMVIVALALSVVRPWGDARAPGARTPAAVHVPAAAPSGRPAPSPAPTLAADQIACPPAGWQVVSLDHLGSWTVRTWSPAAAVRARGPLDPAIGGITLDSPEVLAIGVCSPPAEGTTSAPPVGFGASPDATSAPRAGVATRWIGAWRIEGGAAVPVPLRRRPGSERDGVASLYLPAASGGAGPAAWPEGRFVVEVLPLHGAAGDHPSAGSGGSAPGGWFLGIVIRARG